MIRRTITMFFSFWIGFWRANWRFAALILQPKIDICEAVIVVDFKVEGDFSRYLVATLISYTPGSVAVAIEGNKLHVHIMGEDSEDLEAIRGEIVAFVEDFSRV